MEIDRQTDSNLSVALRCTNASQVLYSSLTPKLHPYLPTHCSVSEQQLHALMQMGHAAGGAVC